MATYRHIQQAEDLEEAFRNSEHEPTLLFLYDPHCPVSWSAEEQVDDLPGVVFRLDVSREHDLKREVAARTGVRHESPQAIVLRDARPTWHASHGRIRTEVVLQVLGTAAAGHAPD